MPQKEPEPLDVDEIKSNLKTKIIGRKVVVFNSTSSTNDVARRYINDKNCNGLAIFTEEQSAGRGRAGNKWFSKRSESILCSIILSDYNVSSDLLSLVCAVSVADAIGRNAKIKWPNDILINNKKVAGILLEASVTNHTYTYILGIGINCHQEEKSFPDELRSIATSIDIENKCTCDRIGLARRLLSSLEYWLEIAEKDGKSIINQWCKLSIQLGQRVTLSYNKKIFSGNCIGIDPEKGLILRLDSGGIRMFEAAQTSIIKK